MAFTYPAWFSPFLGVPLPAEGETIPLAGDDFVMVDGILRQRTALSDQQSKTRDSFGFQWHRRDAFGSEATRTRVRDWLFERYGDPATHPWLSGESPVLLDVGCGAALTTLELFGDVLGRIRYIGAEISDAVEVAVERFAERGLQGAFLQCNLMQLPFADASVDVIYAEGVLHHTDSTERAIQRMARLLKPGGVIQFYVYRRKGPIREYTDDLLRAKLQHLSHEQAWEALMPLTRLGEALGKLDLEVDVPESVDLLDIPAGKINLQRLFYWHVCKAFYRPDYSLEEMNLVNFDWFSPPNAHRQSIDEVRQWCVEAGLRIEIEKCEDAGMTITASRCL